MAHITKIKAKDPTKPVQKPVKEESPKSAVKEVAKAGKTAKVKKVKEKKDKKPFVLFRPFIKLGHYIADSWREIRQVRWPNRKATWKLVLAVFVYTALFLAIITLLDMLFTWLFNIILG